MNASYGRTLHFRQRCAGLLHKVTMRAEIVWPHDQRTRMPQNTKDSQGGKSHAPTKTADRGQTADKAQPKKSSSDSPTGSQKHGEKKTTP